MKEIWKNVEGFEGLYEVSNLGRVKALDRYVLNNGGLQHKKERILKQRINKKKHCTVVLCKDGKTYPKLVHRLVAIAFIPNPDNKPIIDHIDTDPTNNRVDNLRWVTQQENALNPLTRKHISESKMGHEYWGRPLTDEEKKKISEAHKGKTLSESHKKALSKAHKGKKLSKAHRQAVSEAKKGHPTSEETKQKIREKSTGRYKGKTWKIIGGKRVWLSKTEESD